MKVLPAIALAILSIPAFAQPDRTRTSIDNVETGYVATDDGTRLFYQKVGTGKQVVIIPGGLFTFEGFRSLSKGRTLVFYDMRGRGRSDAIADDKRPRIVGIHHDVADVERIRKHFNFAKVSLVGYSYLGLMTVMYAMEHPDRVDRIVQLGPVPLKFGTQYPAEYTNSDKLADIGAKAAEVAHVEKLLKDGYDKSNPKEFCELQWSVTRFRLVGNPANVERLGKGPCHMPNEYPSNLSKHFEHSFGSVQKLDIPRERLAVVKMPVLTIHGTKDRNAVYGAGREWATILPNARLLTVKGAAHQSWADEPEIVLSAIDSFLKGDWPRAAERLSP